MDVPTDLGLVREFYNTLGHVGNRFKCIVRGQHLYITEDVLARILQISTQGYVVNSLSDRVATLRLIFERDDINPVSEIPTSHLSTEMRLLHSIYMSHSILKNW